MAFAPAVLRSREVELPKQLPLGASQQPADFSALEIELFNEALVDLELTRVELSLKSTLNQNLPLEIHGVAFALGDEDRPGSGSQTLAGQETFRFLARSGLNLTLLVSRKQIGELQEKQPVQNVLVLKLNDQKELLVKDGSCLFLLVRPRLL